MTKTFVVAIAGASSDQEKSLSEYFNFIGTWWHWIPNFWLVVVNLEEGDKFSATAIRDAVGGIAPGKNQLVLEVDATHKWAGFGPNMEGNDMFAWIRDSWQQT